MPQIHCTICLCDNPVSKHEGGQKKRDLLKCTCYFLELIFFC